jgi:hypothetical protein
VSLAAGAGERIWLAGFHPPGDSVSSACLKELIGAAEIQTGVRPRRQPERVSQRIAAQQVSLTRTRRLADQQQAKLKQLQQTHPTLTGKQYHTEQVLKGPISSKKQARLRAQADGWRIRLPRVMEHIAQAQSVLSAHQTRLAEQQAELAVLRTWQAQLAADNQANPDPPEIETRIDAGFASGENLTWLLEMGYAPNTKAPNARTTTA